MKTTTTITERGQVSVPAAIRKALALQAGQQLVWERVSDSECRVRVRRARPARPDPVAAVGFGPRALRRAARRTAAWMKELRAGER